MLPALTIERPLSLGASWSATQGSVLAIVVTEFIIAVCFGGPELFIDIDAALMSTGLFSAAGAKVGQTIITEAAFLWACVLVVVFLSIVYRNLVLAQEAVPADSG